MSLYALDTGKLNGWKTVWWRKHTLHSTHEVKEKSMMKLFWMLRDEYQTQGEEKVMKLLELGPKKLFKMGLLKTVGWRRGYTKSLI